MLWGGVLTKFGKYPPLWCWVGPGCGSIPSCMSLVCGCMARDGKDCSARNARVKSVVVLRIVLCTVVRCVLVVVCGCSLVLCVGLVCLPFACSSSRP